MTQPLELLAAASGLMSCAYSGGVPGGGEGACSRVKFHGVIGGGIGPRSTADVSWIQAGSTAGGGNISSCTDKFATTAARGRRGNWTCPHHEGIDLHIEANEGIG